MLCPTRRSEIAAVLSKTPVHHPHTPKALSNPKFSMLVINAELRVTPVTWVTPSCRAEAGGGFGGRATKVN
jgi:hypothetical protein